MTFVVVGGSAGLGRSLARRLAAAGHDLILVSSDERDLSAVAADLRIRYGVRVVGVAADVGIGDTYLDRVAAAVEENGGIDGLLFPVGAVSAGDDGSLDPQTAASLTRVNFLSVVSAVARFLPALRRRSHGVVVGFGSIAATRGRAGNVVYSAAKRALASFFESLRRTCVGSKIIVQFYVLGYLDTGLGVGGHPLFPKADPEVLSRRILRHLGRDIGVVYYPRYWHVLCSILQILPWWVFKRMNFARKS